LQNFSKQVTQLAVSVLVVFLTSTTNSSINSLVSKGISNNLMKIGAKRRRTQEEIRTEKAQEALRLMTIETKMRQFEEMK